MIVDAAAQEGRGQILFGVAGDDDDGQILLVGVELAVSQLRNFEDHILEFVEEIVGEIARRLVDLVDEDDALRWRAGMMEIGGQAAVEGRLRRSAQNRRAERVVLNVVD